MRLPWSRGTLSNFHVLDVKTQNIWLTVNLNAHLSLQWLYRHVACNLELSFRPWKWFPSWVNIYQMYQFWLEAFRNCEGSLTPSSCVLLSWGLRVSWGCMGAYPRHSFCLKPPLALSLSSEKPNSGVHLRFQTVGRNHRKQFTYWLAFVVDN